MFPELTCPFIDQYNEDPDDFECEACQFFVRYPELDTGTRAAGKLAFICKKDSMNPDIVYKEYEPMMPWE
jgi:hypothetical protein